MMTFFWIWLVFVVLAGLAYASERHTWNRDRCRKCGARWEMYDVDSQGGRMYKCVWTPEHTVDISWPLADREYDGSRPVTMRQHLADLRDTHNRLKPRRRKLGLKKKGRRP